MFLCRRTWPRIAMLYVWIFLAGIAAGYAVAQASVPAVIHAGVALCGLGILAYYGHTRSLCPRRSRDQATVLVQSIYRQSIQHIEGGFYKFVPKGCDPETAYLLLEQFGTLVVITRYGWGDRLIRDVRRTYVIDSSGRIDRYISLGATKGDGKWLTRPLCHCRLEYLLHALQKNYSPRKTGSRL